MRKQNNKSLSFLLRRWWGLIYSLLSDFPLFKFQACVFMGFSIISALLGGTIIVCYSIYLAECRVENDRYYRLPPYYNAGIKNINNYEAEIAISASLLVLGLAESVIGIWAAIVSCCLMKPCVCCNCCYTVPDQQVLIPQERNQRYPYPHPRKILFI